jgi:hypothetical protein
LTRRGKIPAQSIIKVKVNSWWRAGRSICLRQKLRSAENKCLSGNPHSSERHPFGEPTGYQLFQFPVFILP